MIVGDLNLASIQWCWATSALCVSIRCTTFEFLRRDFWYPIRCNNLYRNISWCFGSIYNTTLRSSSSWSLSYVTVACLGYIFMVCNTLVLWCKYIMYGIHHITLCDIRNEINIDLSWRKKQMTMSQHRATRSIFFRDTIDFQQTPWPPCSLQIITDIVLVSAICLDRLYSRRYMAVRIQVSRTCWLQPVF